MKRIPYNEVLQVSSRFSECWITFSRAEIYHMRNWDGHIVFKTQGNVLVLLKSEQKSIQDILLFDFPTCLRKSFLVVFLMNLLLNAFSGVSWIIEKGFLPIAEDAEQLEQIGTLIPTSRKINETHFREFKTRGLGLSVRNHFQPIETEHWKTVAYINKSLFFPSNRSLEEATQRWSNKHVMPL